MRWLTLRKLRSRKHKRRSRAIQKLGDSRDMRAVPALTALLNDPARESSWMSAVKALGTIGGSGAAEALAGVMGDERRNDWIRSSVPAALAQIGDETSIRALVVAFRGPNREVSTAAAQALHAVGWCPPESETLRWAILLENWREAACIGISAIEPLASELSYMVAANAPGDSIVGLIDGLAQIKHEDSVLHLGSVIHHEKDYIRFAAVKALGNIGHPSAISLLVGRLYDAFDYVRCQAAGELKHFQDPSIVEPLVDAAKHAPDSGTRSTAVCSLAELRDPRAADLLHGLLEDPDVGWAAAKALQAIERAGNSFFGSLPASQGRKEDDAV